MGYLRKTHKHGRGRFFAAAACLAIVMGLWILSVTTIAEAKTPKNGPYTDAYGNHYIMKNGKAMTGWFKYKGKHYYGYKTASKGKPKGSLAENAYKVRGRRLYYFGENGVRQTKNSRYITLNKASGSVHYIHAPGMIRRDRFNANHRRWQHLTDSGRWKDVGSRGWPEGMIDWQK